MSKQAAGSLNGAFSMPKPVKITGRSSSITNSFVNSIIPVIEPTDQQVRAALEVLQIAHDKIECAYCGDQSTEWDHLNPLVKGKQPTGYISEIENLVPACGKCNQSKGNKPWRVWIVSAAKKSPRTKGVTDLDLRIQRLDKYEQVFRPRKIDFLSIVNAESWGAYWQDRDKIFAAMKDAQVLAEAIKQSVRDAVSRGI